MWRLFNYLFGWDYVNIHNNYDWRVCRIWWRGDTPMVSAYSFQHWELKPPFAGWKVTALTPRAQEILDALNDKHS